MHTRTNILTSEEIRTDTDGLEQKLHNSLLQKQVNRLAVTTIVQYACRQWPLNMYSYVIENLLRRETVDMVEDEQTRNRLVATVIGNLLEKQKRGVRLNLSGIRNGNKATI